MQNKESQRKQRQGVVRRAKGRKMSELARINEEARKVGMSYGQYVGRYGL